jgi:HlyD family secretion protein
MTGRTVISAAAVAAALTLAACGGRGTGLPGTVERDRIGLVAEASEPIVELAVHEGDRVATGALILRLDPRVGNTQLDQARAQVRAASARLLELTRGARSEEVAQARAQLERAQVQVDSERRELERQKALVARQLVSATAVDRQQLAVDSAEAERKRAAAALLELERGTRSEQIEQARAAASEAEARVAELEVSVARLTLRAPEAAIVDALPYKLGERPAKGQTVAILLADRAPFVRIYVPEPLLAQVHAGTSARVSVDGVKEVLAGSVRFVSSDAAFTPYYSLTARDRSRLSFLAEVSLTEPAARALPSGVPAVVRLEVGGQR